jgi:hypothetical protein
MNARGAAHMLLGRELAGLDRNKTSKGDEHQDRDDEQRDTRNYPLRRDELIPFELRLLLGVIDVAQHTQRTLRASPQEISAISHGAASFAFR